MLPQRCSTIHDAAEAIVHLCCPTLNSVTYLSLPVQERNGQGIHISCSSSPSSPFIIGDQKTGSNDSIQDQEEAEEGPKYRESVDSGLDFRPGGMHSSTSSEGTGENPARQWVLGGDQTPPRGSTLPQRQSPIISSHKGHKRTGSDPFAFRNYSYHPRHHHPRPSLGGGLSISSGSPPPHLDFRREAATFKATTIGILTAMHQLIEMCSKREELWQRKFDKVSAFIPR